MGHGLKAAALAVLLAASMPTSAALVDRGGGMIYDDVLNVTWLQDANFAATQWTNSGGTQGDQDGRMTWAATDAWAAGLSYGGFNDWRLPATFNLGPASCDYDLGVYHGGTACGYNIDPATSELASLYAALGNKTRYATNDIYGPEQAGWGFAHTGPFVNVPIAGSPANAYWSGTDYEPRPDSYAWIFRVQDGLQSYQGKEAMNFALALRDGDVAPVPLPAAAWLLLSGLAGLGALGRCRLH